MTEKDREARESKFICNALLVLLSLAFFVRLGVRVAFGEAGFWLNAYTDYYDLAQNVVAGKGFCFDTTCAEWPPLYPAFLALTALGGKHFLLIVIPQALMGASTALLAFLIGREIFNSVTGIIACFITAFYPYYVMHDTAIQETGMLTFCTALSVWLLLRAARLNRNTDWLAAGLALGAIALVRASPAPFIPLALVWAVWFGAKGARPQRIGKASLALLGVSLMIAPWLIRTWWITGSPVLSSQTGSALWKGNNAETFSHYPGGSIDLSSDEAYKTLTPRDHSELDRLQGNEILESDWYAHRAVEYVKQHPGLTLQRAVRKIGAGFSWTLNPVREPLAQAAYFISWVPVALLGGTGMLLAWPRRELTLILMLFLSFVCVTAVFWAHTSHRSYLDVYMVVFAASVIERLYTLRRRRLAASKQVFTRSASIDAQVPVSRSLQAATRTCLDS